MRKRSTLALICLGSLVLAVGIAERTLRWIDYPRHGCGRLTDPSELRVVRFDEELGWSYIPRHSAVGDNHARYTFSRAGYRAADSEDAPDAARPAKVLLVGDSMLFGHGLEYRDTFGHKLQERLDARLGARHEVLNFAVQAYGTDQTALMLRRVLTRFSPEVIVVDFIGEHLARNVSEDRRELFPCLRFLGTKPRFELEGDRLRLGSRPELFAVYDDPRVRLLFRRALAGPVDRRVARTGVAITRALLAEIQHLAAERESALFLLSFANAAETDAVNPGIPAAVVEWETPENRGYFLSDTDHHPNAAATTMLVDRLLEIAAAGFAQGSRRAR
ncbi:MAG: hypothetical protein ACREQQ_07810 [Candidatus Binatia bacterium]